MLHQVLRMEVPDLRSPSRDAQLRWRVQVIRLRKTGIGCDEIAAQTGLSRTGVFGVSGTEYTRARRQRCVGWDDSLEVLKMLSAAVQARRAA